MWSGSASISLEEKRQEVHVVKVLALAAAGSFGAFVLALVILAGGTATSTTVEGAAAANLFARIASQECIATGPVPGLTATQAGNAEQIVAAADVLSGESPTVARISLMTAYDESRLLDLGPESGNDGSLGLFQQRITEDWGTAAQEENPTDATRMFVKALLALPGWRQLSPWAAAQEVQRSADSSGSNYERYWQLSATLLRAIDADATTSKCGAGNPSGPLGPPSRYGLPIGYVTPADADRAEATAVGYAVAQLGKPYVWGGAGPQVFDCSGLTMAAWAKAGFTLLHSSNDQLDEGSPATIFTIRPGDLVLVPGSDGTLADPGHVGIYLGDGLVLSAVDPQYGVIVQTWASFTAGGLSGIRQIG
jgi:cell wall-associated NlpC family hydrolase